MNMKILIGTIFILVSFQSLAGLDTETVFLYPWQTENEMDLSIEKRMIKLIDDATWLAKKSDNPEGFELYLSMYRYDGREGLYKALKRAAKTGMKLNLIFGVKSYDMVKKVKKKLGRKKNVRIKTCPRGCLGENINHNKFLLLSRSRDGQGRVQDHVVAQTSYNFDNRQPGKVNDLVIVYGQEELYAIYKNYWETMRRSAGEKDLKISDAGLTHKKGDFEVYFSPRRYSDPIVDIFKRVECSREETVIHISQSRWDRGRKEIADYLKGLVPSNCHLRVLINGSKIIIDESTEREFEHLYLRRKIHTKFMLIDGNLDGKKTESCGDRIPQLYGEFPLL